MTQPKPVLIVGAGPTGLTLACDLLRRGISFRIIDQSQSATTVSKAIVIHARTLELLENMGIVEPFLENGLPVRGTNFYAGGKRIVHLNMDEIESHYKYALAIPQSKTEELLTNVLSASGVKVDRNFELLDFSQTADSVLATIKNLETGAEEKLEYSYLAGCDGAHSRTRKTLGFSFEGAEYEELFGAADVACDIQGDEMFGYLSEHGNVIFFPFGDGRFRIIFELPHDNPQINGRPVDENEPITLALVEEVVKERVGRTIKIEDPHWLSWFKVHRRFADGYRKGRVFILGDAAHIHSPVGGVGMNTGMQDSINLGWKLALCLKGLSDDSLLDTYEEERKKVGQSVLKGTHMATKFVTFRHPVAVNLRNSLMHILASQELVQQRILRSGSLTGVSYRSSSLSCECHPPIDDSLGRTLRLSDDDGEEKPGLGAWIEFARAPVAGDRALDGDCRNERGDERRLCQYLSSERFQLLLFDGFVASPDGYQGFKRIEDHVNKYFKNLIDVHVIVPEANGVLDLPNYNSVIYDFDRLLHKTYGASSECLYLIRPDGYIGFRSQPASLDDLVKYLSGVFVLSAVGS
jgi:2-polyprenyl-6-methoxyphenol hydroxylase-like FAD-dependent oxidoreductase